ncbi:FAD-dependent monooxygenase [Allosphingosinicella deserti]|uniref:FAD-binding domain-containing protein n=1 Tax=Allosphingosinicella deserti TaxID=2116704 RepID=A0A2P7QFG6_9SPHN|nr:FAD-dependent monooxygenase [Sphingomonas deserti]PSJ36684.1 hypothetical protein C7I55_25185 [Sphingomonas deserti]
MQTFDHQVVIAGGGPTGLMLAGELALAGVDVAIVERRRNQEVEGSRASGFHPRALELLDQRGLAERFVAQGTKHHAVPIAGAILEGSDRPTRYNYTLGLWQAEIEHGLADWICERKVRIYRGCEVTGFTEGANRITIQLRDGRSLAADYLVGCDGGRSLIRKAAGIAFPGWDPSISYLIFEADMSTDPELGVRYGERGLQALSRLDDGRRVRGVVTEQRLERGDRPPVEALRDALVAAYGTDFGVHDVTWLSRFTDAARQAACYRKGRILLAGDSAHVHSPVGGQGLNMGLQDAVNLGWKLAQVVRGISPDALLDTYHSERHPAGATLLKHTLALTALNRGDDRTTALRALMADVMRMDAPRRWYAAMISGLDVRYALGEGHEMLGRRMPDLDIICKDGPTRVFELLHDATPVLLNLGQADLRPAAEWWADRIKIVDARYHGAIELPVIGLVPTPAEILIRPDGHVAWVGNGNTDGLADACGAWFGNPRQ